MVVTVKLDDDEYLYLIKGKCCTTWPLLIGIPPRRCGLCGTRPTIIEGTEYTIPRKPAESRWVKVADAR